MANKEAKYDKVLLAVAALAALGVAGTLYAMKSGFPENLAVQHVTPKSNFGVIPQEEVTAAIDRLQKPFEWTAPMRDNKPVPLNKSVTIVTKGGELFDMFVENPQLRPPMTNKFLRDNDLDYLSPNVGELDPDDDGFTNIEEFNKQTNPKDAKSHPPLTDHLYFKDRVQNNYILVLQSSAMPVQVKRTEPAPSGSVFVDVLPKEFGFDKGATTQRFSAEKFEHKVLKDPATGVEKDVSELTVMDKATGQHAVLIYRFPFNLAEYMVTLEFRNKTVQSITVKKGEKFRLTGVGSTYVVVDIQEENATLAELKEDGSQGAKFVVSKRP